MNKIWAEKNKQTNKFLRETILEYSEIMNIRSWIEKSVKL